MVKRHLLCIFCLALVLPSCSPIGEHGLDQPSMDERIDDIFTRYADSDEFSGADLASPDDEVSAILALGWPGGSARGR